MVGPAELRIKLDRPAYVYPLFEQALRIKAGESSDSTAGESVNCGRSSARWHRTIHTHGAAHRFGRADLATR